MNRIILFFILFAFITCNEKEIKYKCPPYDNYEEPPYNNPVWHPSGKIIGFNHIPLKEINYIYGIECPLQASYAYEQDSIGFWLIDTDGTNQRRVLPYYLIDPAWSPDGNWIAFSRSAQVCIMPFDGVQFDTTAIVQLTNEGRNFFPAWNHDGNKIAFEESICTEPLKCGIWVYDFSASEIQYVAKYGIFPSWQPFSDTLIFQTNALNNNGEDIGDSIWIYKYSTNEKQLLKFISLPNYDNRNLSYSPNGNYIAFISMLNKDGEGIQLYTINSDGSNLRKLTTEGCYNFSWSPDGKIVYVNYDNPRMNETKGTLWIMDPDGNNKYPLTYNTFKLIQ